jgi:hypothetical protein
MPPLYVMSISALSSVLIVSHTSKRAQRPGMTLS